MSAFTSIPAAVEDVIEGSSPPSRREFLRTSGLFVIGVVADQLPDSPQKEVVSKMAVGYFATSKKSALLRWPVRRSLSL